MTARAAQPRALLLLACVNYRAAPCGVMACCRLQSPHVWAMYRSLQH